MKGAAAWRGNAENKLVVARARKSWLCMRGFRASKLLLNGVTRSAVSFVLYGGINRKSSMLAWRNGDNLRNISRK